MTTGYKSLSEIRKACRSVNSCATGSDGFMYKCFPFFLEQLAEMNEKLDLIATRIAKRQFNKRNPSQYNLHVAAEVRSGKSFLEAVKSWKQKK